MTTIRVLNNTEASNEIPWCWPGCEFFNYDPIEIEEPVKE